MDQLKVHPIDHAALCGQQPAPEFYPTRHNWLRPVKVPALVINATTVSTGNAWQFTTTWMGGSPWAIHPFADCVPRLHWTGYDAGSG